MSSAKDSRWHELLALSTVIFAVCSTIAWYKDSGHSTDAILSQSQASNAWSLYQSKSLKSYLYEISRDKLLLEQKMLDPSKQDAARFYSDMISDYTAKIGQYDEDKKEAESRAKGLEVSRDRSQLFSGAFGRSMMALQIAIVLSSLAALFERKNLWYMSMAVGAGGLVYFINGWWLFF